MSTLLYGHHSVWDIADEGEWSNSLHLFGPVYAFADNDDIIVTKGDTNAKQSSE